ncbi:MAG: hypothetical protein NC116_10630 [Clostridium sp.]|nr:hypothetical protein [Clostridium sp.]
MSIIVFILCCCKTPDIRVRERIAKEAAPCAGALPSESRGGGHPQAFRAEDLLEHVPAAAAAAGERGDVEADGADVAAGILGAAGAAGSFHHFVVGDVVAHVEDFFVRKAVGGEEPVVGPELDGASHEDVRDSEALVAPADGDGRAAGEDGHPQPEPDGELYGVAVLDVGGAQGHAGAVRRDSPGGQHAVDVEDDCLYPRKVVGNHSNAPLS